MLRIIFTLLLCIVSFNSVFAAEIFDISIRQKPDSLVSELIISGSGFSDEYITAFQIKKGAPRFVIDCQSCAMPKLGEVAANHQRVVEGQGTISKVRMAKRDKDVLRLVLDLKNTPKYLKYNINNDNIQVLITSDYLSNASYSTQRISENQTSIKEAGLAVPRLKPPQGASNSTPIPRLKPTLAALRRPIIVIDPGHGGHDPGAIGNQGTQEKAITLSAALELKNMLQKTGKYKVILTRSDDKYIEHEERLRIARAGGADLFISLHADSASPSARGASVYTLADRALSRSKGLVETQNWIMDVDLSKQSDPVSDILVDLAQRTTFSHSTDFADVLVKKLEPKTTLINNTHRRAGYFVLLAPDVPAILLELGFISNAEDEALLKSIAHRKKINTAVTSAIETYFNAQKP